MLCLVGNITGIVVFGWCNTVLVVPRVIVLGPLGPILGTGLALNPVGFCKIVSACVAKWPKCVME